MKSKYTKDLLEPLVKSSNCISEVVRKATGKPIAHGSMIDLIGKKIKEYGIDSSHFNGNKWCLGRVNPTGRAWSKDGFVKHFLVKGGPYITTCKLKKRLVEFCLLEYRCCMCGVGPQWNGKPLVLQIDHIDGDKTNNEICNLSIKCPNCHSQTATFAGRNNIGGTCGRIPQPDLNPGVPETVIVELDAPPPI